MDPLSTWVLLMAVAVTVSAVSKSAQGCAARFRPQQSAFAAILEDGSVVSWGLDPYCGGDSSAVQHQLRGVQQIQVTEQCLCCNFGRWILWLHGVMQTPWRWQFGSSTSAQGCAADSSHSLLAFAAVLADGSVVYLGSCSPWQWQSRRLEDQLRGVQQIQATGQAFAAILADGTVVTWGNAGLWQWLGRWQFSSSRSAHGCTADSSHSCRHLLRF